MADGSVSQPDTERTRIAGHAGPGTARRVLSQPTAALRAGFQNLQQESELVVVILRTALILLAVLAPAIGEGAVAPRLALQISVVAALVYNTVVFLLYWRRVRLRGQRVAMIVADILLVSAWIFLTWNNGVGDNGSPLFPFYYVVIIISALWFGVSGLLGTASLITVIYLLICYQASGYDPFALVDALYRHVIYIFLVSIAAGYLVDTHKREREQWTRSQVLLAQYQERFRAAQEVYEVLIPSHAPQVPGLELASRWRPALQEGAGDFYDVVVPSPGRAVIAIADVSGKHSRGAMKLPLFKAAFLACAQVWEEPGQVLQQVNRIVYPYLQPDMFISACVVSVDLDRHQLSFANAGQDPPILVRELTRDIAELHAGGMVLGIDRNAAYPTDRLDLEPGDTLCLYTDGITEARNPEAEEFGQEHLTARVQAAVALGLPADGIAENIFDAVSQFVRGEARHDDMTLLVMRYRPDERARTAS